MASERAGEKRGETVGETPQSPLVFFPALSLALHHLNAWNRLGQAVNFLYLRPHIAAR